MLVCDCMSYTQATCAACGKKFNKSVSEFNRTQRRNSRHFCSRSCSAKIAAQENPAIKPRPDNLRKGRTRDEFTPFRWFVARARDRASKKGSTNLTPEYLKQLWDKQEGKCPITSHQLLLPRSTEGWDDFNIVYRASLDRIDHKKGYIQGNVRFVSYIANIGRQCLDDFDLVRFCLMTTASQSVRVKFVEQRITQFVESSNRIDTADCPDMTRTFEPDEEFQAIPHPYDGTYRISAKSNSGEWGMYIIEAEVVEKIG